MAGKNTLWRYFSPKPSTSREGDTDPETATTSASPEGQRSAEAREEDLETSVTSASTSDEGSATQSREETCTDEEDLSQGFTPKKMKLEPTETGSAADDASSAASVEAAGNSDETKGKESPTTQTDRNAEKVTFAVQFPGMKMSRITVPGNQRIIDALKEEERFRKVKNLQKALLWPDGGEVKGSPNMGSPCSSVKGGKFEAKLNHRLADSQIHRNLSKYGDNELHASERCKIYLDVHDQTTKRKWITKMDPNKYHSGVISIDGLPTDSLMLAMLRDGRIERKKVKVTELTYKEESGKDINVGLTDSIQDYDGNTFVCTVGSEPQVTEQTWKDALGRMHHTMSSAVKDEGGRDNTASTSPKPEDRTDQATSSSGTHTVKNQEVNDLEEEMSKLCIQSQRALSKGYNLDFEEKRPKSQKEKKRREVLDEFAGEFRQHYDDANNINGTPVWQIAKNAKLMKQLVNLSQSVGMIRKLKSKVYGTCFRVGTRYVMTNRHVAVKLFSGDARDVVVDFHYLNEPDPNEKTDPNQTIISFKVREVYDSRPLVQDELDYSVLELDIAPGKFDLKVVQEKLPGLGHSVGEPDKGRTVRIIGYPAGKEIQKKIDVNCPVVDPKEATSYALYIKFYQQMNDAERATYRSVFRFGTSGSPGFDDDGKLVVMHTGGYRLHEGSPNQIEQGIRMSAIQKDLSKHQPDLCQDIFGLPNVQLQPSQVLIQTVNECDTE